VLGSVNNGLPRRHARPPEILDLNNQNDRIANEDPDQGQHPENRDEPKRSSAWQQSHDNTNYGERGYHALEKHLGAVAINGRDIKTDSAEAAQTMLDRIEQRRVVNWGQRDDIQNEMRNDLDDYLFDVVRDQNGYTLTPSVMDEIIDRLLSIARARMPD